MKKNPTGFCGRAHRTTPSFFSPLAVCMNVASLSTLRVACCLLDQTGAKHSQLRTQINCEVRNNEWRVLQRIHHARAETNNDNDASGAASAAAASITEPAPTRTGQSSSTNAVVCSLCRRSYVGPGTDCLELRASHAPGVGVVVCASCVFTEMMEMTQPKTLVHGVAKLYSK